MSFGLVTGRLIALVNGHFGSTMSSYVQGILAGAAWGARLGLLLFCLVGLPSANKELRAQWIQIIQPQPGTVFGPGSGINVGGSCFPSVNVTIRIEHIQPGQPPIVMDSVGTTAHYGTWGGQLEPGPRGWMVGNTKIVATLWDGNGVIAVDEIAVVIQQGGGG